MTSIVLPSPVNRFLHVAVFLFIPVAIAAPHMVTWEIIIGGLTALYYNRKYSLTKFSQPLIFILLAIPFWALITSLWAKYPVSSLLTSLKILGLITLGLYWCRFTSSLPSQIQKSLVKSLVSGLLCGLFFLTVDLYFDKPWQTFWQKSSAKAFAQGSLMMSLAMWPTALWILRLPYSFYQRSGLLISLVIFFFSLLLQIDCDTSFIGLFMGICVFLGTLLLPRLTSWGMRFLIPLFIASFPFISLFAFKPEYISTYNAYFHSPSYIERLYLWNDVATTIFEHPWKGVGADGTRQHEKSQHIRTWAFTDQAGEHREVKTNRFGIHPHNAILQLWLELGVFGLVLGIYLAYRVLLKIYCGHLTSLEKAISSGLFVGTFLIIWVNLGIWQNWWNAGLWMIIGLTIGMFKNKRETDEKVCS